MVNWRELYDPYHFASLGNHLWIATCPTFGGFVVLFLMGNADLYPTHLRLREDPDAGWPRCNLGLCCERVLNERSKKYMSSPMPREKQFDRDAALDKAMRTFWARGYEATSVQDLLDSMGLNRGSLYATFGDKHALFLEALRMYDREVRQRLLRTLREKLSPKEAIRELLRSFERQSATNSPGHGCFLTNTALELAAHDKEARSIVAQSQEEIETFFAETIRAGQRTGEISLGISPRNMARGLLASFIGLVVLTRSRPEPALLKSIVDDAVGRLD